MTTCTSPIVRDWNYIAVYGGQFLAPRAEQIAHADQSDDGRIFPPLEMLKRIWDASDKHWMQAWLAADGDESDDACED